MLTKTYPEYFGSYKLYETVRNILLKNFREVDIENMFNEMNIIDAHPDNFMKKLGQVMQKHAQSTKCSNILMDIKERLSDLIGINVEPPRIVMTKHEKPILKITIQNKTDGMLKFRVGVEQIDRKYTALLYDPVKTFTYTKMIKSHLIEPDKIYAFKFVIKPDVFGIQDLYELKKTGKLNITLGMQADAEGIDGLKSTARKINVEIVKMKL
jgi:hypothetical protein